MFLCIAFQKLCEACVCSELRNLALFRVFYLGGKSKGVLFTSVIGHFVGAIARERALSRSNIRIVIVMGFAFFEYSFLKPDFC